MDGGNLMINRVFLNKVFSFLGMGLALYGIASFYQWVASDPIIKRTVKCKYCRKWISEKVSSWGLQEGDVC